MAGVKNTANRYKVPQRQWRKWNAQARHVFNELFGQMATNQELLSHPQMGKVSQRMWRTLCWNAAWLAADASREYTKADHVPALKADKILDVTPKGRVVRERRPHAPLH